MEIKFLGSNHHVTGSKHLLIGKDHNILIDCGLYQGENAQAENLKIDEIISNEKIDAVILTHGHLDHCGYLPKLHKDGFQGPIFCTEATMEIAKIILTDNAKIQSHNASKHNKKTKKESLKIKPLYTQTEVDHVLNFFQTKKMNTEFSWKEFSINLKEAGHILGAVSPLIKNSTQAVQFSGDIGRQNDISHFPPSESAVVDALIIESTYGSREHIDINLSQKLKPIFADAIKHNKAILIPAFSLARSQNLMKVLLEFFNKNKELEIPVYIDSPMTIAITAIYQKYSKLHRISKAEIKEFMQTFHFPEYKSQKENLDKLTNTHIILTASGMLSGGNILHHLQTKGVDENNIIFIVGFQAPGTFGHDLLNGDSTFSSDGKKYHVKAEVINFTNFSSHADCHELVNWAQSSKAKKVFITHGEANQKEALKANLSHKMDSEIIIPNRGEIFQI